MNHYSRSKLDDWIFMKATAWENEQIRQDMTSKKNKLISKSEILKTKNWLIENNRYLLDNVFEQFNWYFVKNPFGVDRPVTEWRHAITNNIFVSDFNGLIGHNSLNVSHSNLEYHLK